MDALRAIIIAAMVAAIKPIELIEPIINWCCRSGLN
jgi:hypothetical protein